ncbi:type II toxin-antitoxin system HicB family antitoxin [Nitratireductor sp. CH_MIT9313-5]|uniref:type II toxin-antitoxin system HicB family antitoxin n=1 Tax=Nitratireductor sp. CH_MIT9313-5 TaxID=3107764 RepID=UPI003009FB7D
MRHYIALIHKDAGSSYGVCFPDLPGVIAAASTLDECLTEASTALAFALADLPDAPQPRTLDTLRIDPQFLEDSKDAVVAAVSPAPHIFEAA